MYVNDSVGLTKKTLFLHDFYVKRPLFWLFTIAQEADKVLQGDVSLPFIGLLRVDGNMLSDARWMICRLSVLLCMV